MGSPSKSLELCDKLSVGLNAFIKNTSKERQKNGEQVWFDDNQRAALTTLYITFLTGIASVLPEENMLLIDFTNPEDKEIRTTIELDLQTLYISTLVNTGNIENLDDTFIPDSLRDNAENQERSRQIETLSQSLVQKFPAALIHGLRAEVHLITK